MRAPVDLEPQCGDPARWERRIFVPLGRFLFRSRKFVFTALFLTVAWIAGPGLPLGNERLDRWLDVLGIGMALSGQGLRAAVIGLAYIRRGGKEGTIYADDLVQDGLFAHSRNPLYLGNVLVYLGLFLILDSVWGYLVGLPLMVLSYYAIVVAEEDYLERRFGDAYVSYCRRVPRFLPSTRGLPATLRSMRFQWGRLIRKEYGSAFAWVSVALALLAWESFTRRGYPASRPAVLMAFAAWIPALAAYSTARYLKKTRRLGSA